MPWSMTWLEALRDFKPVSSNKKANYSLIEIQPHPLYNKI